MKVLRPANSISVKENEPLLVIELLDDGSRQIIESQRNEERAAHAVTRLCQHAGIDVLSGVYEIHHINTIECIDIDDLYR